MIKTFIFTFHLALACCLSFGQFTQIEKLDSFKHQLTLEKEDTNRVLMMSYLAWHYSIWNPDSGIVYGQKALALAKQIKFPRGEARALIGLAGVSSTQGDLPKTLEYGFKALRIVEENHFLQEKAMCFTAIGNQFSELDGNPKEISYYQEADSIYSSLKDKSSMGYWEILNKSEIARVLFWANPTDSTLVYMQGLLDSTMHSDYWHIWCLIGFAEMEFQLDKHEAALDYARQSIEILKNYKFHYGLTFAYADVAEFFKELNQTDSSIYYGRQALTEAKDLEFKREILEISLLLAEQYESKDIKEALYFRKVYDSANDEMYGEKKTQSLQKIVSEEQQRQRNIEAERVAYQNRLKQYVLLSGLGVFLLIAFLLYRNNRNKQKANNLLAQQKQKVESTLTELKSTQTQLIQSEKMASLGQLTAGIAHEIQNPLNFVNNFSDVNKELVDELQHELKAGKIDDAIAISNDIKENEDKINHHGKRADAIVKGMLQHSRSSTGVKEPTDINVLADEYLRLAYHGIRGKDSSFNVTLKTDFDNTIGNVNIIPQDIGRVFLNLYNNAFYAVNEKKKQQPENYEPSVSVSTKKINDKPDSYRVEIKVNDNGNGIPQNIVDKIFQPFFTTKPTGQGTGLGLSLAYDIVKTHGGDIRVATKEGEYSEFSVILPS
jgi:two-component system, NtrC family, sensor kinase